MSPDIPRASSWRALHILPTCSLKIVPLLTCLLLLQPIHSNAAPFTSSRPDGKHPSKPSGRLFQAPGQSADTPLHGRSLAADDSSQASGSAVPAAAGQHHGARERSHGTRSNRATAHGRIVRDTEPAPDKASGLPETQGDLHQHSMHSLVIGICTFVSLL